MSLQEILNQVQSYFSNKYIDIINEDSLTLFQNTLKHYLDSEKIVYGKYSQKKLINFLTEEMIYYSFLTKYLQMDNIEEININSYDNIEITYRHQKAIKMKEKFFSRQHAENIIKRLLHKSKMIIDNSSPIVLGYLANNIRIAAIKSPIIDEDIGISASIRFVATNQLKVSDLTSSGFITNQMLLFLEYCLRAKISVCIAGETSSGKTTLCGFLLNKLASYKRIFTIENGSRELNIKDAKSMISTITRNLKNSNFQTSQEDLLDVALRFNPDLICVGEMRSSEAFTAQEAARTGHAVLTTIHCNNAIGAYKRMMTLCKRKYDINSQELLSLVKEAFPIIVYMKKLENNQRLVMEIIEADELSYRSIFKYKIKRNYIEDSEVKIEGEFVNSQKISDNLYQRFIDNGITEQAIKEIFL